MGLVPFGQKEPAGRRVPRRLLARRSREGLIEDLSRACTIAHGQTINQTLPDNLVYSVRQAKEGFAQIDAIPTLEAKLAVFGNALEAPVVSAFVSYTGNRSMGDLDPHLNE